MTKTTKKPPARKNAKQVCIVVLGMPHSGASALVGTLGQLGSGLPKSLKKTNAPEEASSFASQEINDLMERLLTSAKSRWDDWCPLPHDFQNTAAAQKLQKEAQRLLKKEYGTSDIYALQSSQMSRAVPFWNGVWTSANVEPKFAIIYRDPAEVATSLQRDFAIPPHSGKLMWLRHILEAEAATRGRDRSILNHDALMQDPEKCVKKLETKLGLSFPRSATEAKADIAAFLGGSRQHTDRAAPLSEDAPNPCDWVAQTVEVLEHWGRNAERKKDYAMLDAVRSAFDAACINLAPLVATHAGTGAENLGETEDHFAQFEEVIAGLEELTQTQDLEIAQLKHELRSRKIQHTKEQQNRFEESAALSQNIAAQDAALLAERQTIQTLNEAVEDSKAKQNHLADRLKKVLAVLLTDNSLFKYSLPYFAERRKARLLEKTGLFDPDWYLSQNPDVKEAGSNPTKHFVKNGYDEGRTALPELKALDE